MLNFLRKDSKTFFVLYSVVFQCFTRKMKKYIKKLRNSLLYSKNCVSLQCNQKGDAPKVVASVICLFCLKKDSGKSCKGPFISSLCFDKNRNQYIYRCNTL